MTDGRGGPEAINLIQLVALRGRECLNAAAGGTAGTYTAGAGAAAAAAWYGSTDNQACMNQQVGQWDLVVSKQLITF